MSDVRLGGVQLDDIKFDWSFFRGALPRAPITLRQTAKRLPELLALPRVTFLEFEAPSEAGVNDPAHEILRVEGVRILNIDDLDGEFCEITIGDVRDDLALRINDADVNMLFKNGYLDLTDFDRITDWLKYVMLRIPELNDSAGDKWDEKAQAAPLLPDTLAVAGPNLCRAIDLLCEYSGLSFTVWKDGKWRLVPRDGKAPTIPTAAYNWLAGVEPSWTIRNRTSRSMPQTVRFHYLERHALVLRFESESSKYAQTLGPLDIGLQQAYEYQGKFLALPDLLFALGYAPDFISDTQIAGAIMTKNWQSSPMERGKTQRAADFIAIAQRDWRHLYRIVYPVQGGIGRSGGWMNLEFGTFEVRADKDGNPRVTGQLSAAGAHCEFTEYLNQAEYLVGQPEEATNAFVARSHTLANTPGLGLPTAPFSVNWVSREDEIIRISPNPVMGARAVYPGRMAGAVEHLKCQLRNYVVDDQGQVTTLDAEYLHVPTPEDIVLDHRFTLEVIAVATRRLPNDATRWTQIDVPFAADGGVPLMEIEVGPTPLALRDYFDPLVGKGRESDGLGLWLNKPDLELDAQDRAKILNDRLAVERAGSAVANGVSVALDYDIDNAISELKVLVDYPVILTEVHVGEFETHQAQLDRKRRREAKLATDHGGVPVV